MSSREARQAKAAAFLARPTLELESAVDRNGNTVRVGDSVEFAPGRTTVVTRLYSEPSSSKAYEPAAAEVTNTMVGEVVVSLVTKA